MRSADRHELRRAHWHCGCNQPEIVASEQCGCFYCLETFSPRDIREWIDETYGDGRTGKTAICPKCGIDSVIGEESGYPITKEFLERMHKAFF